MTSASIGNPPGFDVPKTAASAALLWSSEGQIVRMVTLDAASEDAGNTPSTRLRVGLVLARHEATGKYRPYDAAANDGTQNPVGILSQAVDMLVDGQPADRVVRMLIGGAVRERLVPNLDPRVRDVLAGQFRFDELPQAPSDRSPFIGKIKHVSGSYTIDPAEHATTFLLTGSGTLTLPAPQPGLAFRFVQTTDNPLSVAGAENLMARGSSGATWLQFDTAGERIGTHVTVECLPLAGGTLAWLVSNPGGTTYSTS